MLEGMLSDSEAYSTMWEVVLYAKWRGLDQAVPTHNLIRDFCLLICHPIFIGAVSKQ